MLVSLAEAVEVALYGTKATRLGAAVRSGLPVPPGVALSVELLESMANEEPAAVHKLAEILERAGGVAAVRSSVVGEDSKSASCAGLFVTELNVTSPSALLAALQSVYRSASTPAALLYQQRMGAQQPSKMAAIVQKMVPAQCGGVLFTHDPLTGEPTYLIEAAWGLGDSVVAGRVIPDSYRLELSGRVLERKFGLHDTQLQLRPGGGTHEIAVPASSVRAPCLDDEQLAQLYNLARHCQTTFGPKLDLEWALAEGDCLLLECRPITR